ncbi:MAG: 50S ribosomal protein L32e [Candidatus Thermoplasmatota archaeon]|nr:50S ribosomal protein L32e [Candidatus Thermoplasmatota archaeon]MCL5962990.1 50S ribosomal protein L32e [Candidatus Thermoplasmatota archaeon]
MADEIVKSDDKVTSRIRPVLDEKLKEALQKREVINRKRVAFRRQSWYRYKRLSRTGWRKPRGLHSKQRRHYGYRPPVVSIGYGSPKITRGFHPSGFKEVLIFNTQNLDKIDNKVYAVRIAGSVGVRKRIVIEKKAAELKLRILNPLHR